MPQPSDQVERLDGKIAVVLGGDEWVGREVACLLGQNGAAVVVAGLAMDHGHRTVEFIRALGGEAGFFYGNVGDKTSFDELLDYALGEYGRVDVVVLASLGTTPLTDRLDDLTQVTRQQEEHVSVIVALPSAGSRASLEQAFYSAIADSKMDGPSHDGRLWANAVAGIVSAEPPELAEHKLRVATPFLLLAHAANRQTRGTVMWIDD